MSPLEAPIGWTLVIIGATVALAMCGLVILATIREARDRRNNQANLARKTCIRCGEWKPCNCRAGITQ